MVSVHELIAWGRSCGTVDGMRFNVRSRLLRILPANPGPQGAGTPAADMDDAELLSLLGLAPFPAPAAHAAPTAMPTAAPTAAPSQPEGESQPAPSGSYWPPLFSPGGAGLSAAAAPCQLAATAEAPPLPMPGLSAGAAPYRPPGAGGAPPPGFGAAGPGAGAGAASSSPPGRGPTEGPKPAFVSWSAANAAKKAAQRAAAAAASSYSATLAPAPTASGGSTGAGGSAGAQGGQAPPGALLAALFPQERPA